MLELKNATKHFDGLKALSGVNFTVEKKEIIGLIGPNGAGKTTVFNVVTGIYTLDFGTLEFEGKKLNGLKPHKITEYGVARTFQNLRLFPNMSAIGNVMVGKFCRTKANVWSTLWHTKTFKEEEKTTFNSAYKLLNFVGLEDRTHDLAKNFPYGEQRCLEIARALATMPKLLLLDEPTAGMNPTETEVVMNLVRKIRESGITILIIEHDMNVIMGICDRIMVLDYGEKLAEGTPSEIRQNPKVIEAYLGKQMEHESHEYANDTNN